MQRLGDLNLGPNTPLSLATILLLAYVITKAAWQLSKDRIDEATRVIVSAEPKPATPWDYAKGSKELASVPLRDIASAFVGPWLVTGVVLGTAIISGPVPLASPIVLLLAWRLLFLTSFAALVAGMRRVGKTGTVEAAGPVPQKVLFVQQLSGNLGVAVYYGIQVWLLLQTAQAPQLLGLGSSQLVLIAIGAATLVKWMNEVTWPLVRYYSEVVRALQSVDSQILIGKLVTADAVAAKVKALMSPPTKD